MHDPRVQHRYTPDGVMEYVREVQSGLTVLRGSAFETGHTGMEKGSGRAGWLSQSN